MPESPTTPERYRAVRGPNGEPLRVDDLIGPEGPQGEPGDPTELLAILDPGDALTVDTQGAPAPLSVARVVRPGEEPTGQGVELIFGAGGLDNITIDGVDA